MPKIIEIGSPGSLPFLKVILNDKKEPIKINNNETVPKKNPKFIPVFETTIE